MIPEPRFLPESESTQEELKRLLTEDPALPEFSSVQAGRQTGGRGRQGRAWQSPEGNLYLSVLVRQPGTYPVTWVPHRVALAALSALRDLGAADRIGIKWPNDLLVDGVGKIAGVICEIHCGHVIAGVGVNVRYAPEVADRQTACLADLIGVPGADLRFALRDRLLERLRSLPGKMEDLRALYEARLLFRTGETLHWADTVSGEETSGKFERIGEFGELIVTTKQGRKSLYSEEIRLKGFR